MKSTISSKGWALLCLVPFALFFFVFQIEPPVSYTHLTLPTKA